jgi:hypothetical protein
MEGADVAEDLEGFEGVPDNMRSLIEHIGFITKELDDDEAEVYGPLLGGRCMTCHSPLGDQTIFFVTANGIVAGYCGGPCVQDMAVLGWLSEQHDDIVDNINFRGGRGDQPESD